MIGLIALANSFMVFGCFLRSSRNSSLDLCLASLLTAGVKPSMNSPRLFLILGAQPRTEDRGRGRRLISAALPAGLKRTCVQDSTSSPVRMATDTLFPLLLLINALINIEKDLSVPTSFYIKNFASSVPGVLHIHMKFLLRKTIIQRSKINPKPEPVWSKKYAVFPLKKCVDGKRIEYS